MNGQNKKLNPERKIRPGLAWWIYIAKKILAVNAGGKVMKKKPAMRDLLTAGLEVVNTLDADAVSLHRKKLVATASCREGVYNRAGEPSAIFCGKGGGYDVCAL